MTPLGKLIETHRVRIGLTRSELAARLGVTTQTVLNIERDRNYNIGTKLLRQLEPILGIEFFVTTRSTMETKQRIEMGNDEFILYLRKRYPANQIPNNQLGKRIWQWIRDQSPTSEKRTEETGAACLWGTSGAFVGDTALPATAAQFEFDRELLPALYSFLDVLGRANTAVDEVLSVFDRPSRAVIDALLARWKWHEPRAGEREVMLDTGDPQIQLKLAPYAEFGTGQHIVLWVGEGRIAQASKLLLDQFGSALSPVPQSESINIPLSKLKPNNAEQLIGIVEALIPTNK